MTRREVLQWLEKWEVRPSRQLGQNFLCEQGVARALVEELGLDGSQRVVEVGPGTGALTEFVVERAREVILIEYDARLAEALRERFAGVERVMVHNVDAARFPWKELMPGGPVSFLGNLPYSAGGAILRQFFHPVGPVEGGLVMLQKEMIERMVAAPRCKAYGVLSLRMQAFWEMEVVREVGPSCFFPEPAVDSWVISLKPRWADRPVFDFRLFDELIRRGFSQRRKKLLKSLPDEAAGRAALAELGKGETVRAEELSVEEWVELTRLLDPVGVAGGGQRADELLNLCDERGEVVGAEERGAIHAQGLRHQAVHALVLNRRGEIFLQRRSRLKDVCPGKWDSSAAGHVDAGEGFEEALHRELREELGLVGTAPREVGRLEASEETGQEFVRLYALLATGPVRTPAVEVECGEWFDQGVLARWVRERPGDFAPGFRACWGLWVEANPGRFEEGRAGAS